MKSKQEQLEKELAKGIYREKHVEDEQESDENDSSEDGATEHYLDVGKSRLRETELSGKYAGRRVARTDLHDESGSNESNGSSQSEMESGMEGESESESEMEASRMETQEDSLKLQKEQANSLKRQEAQKLLQASESDQPIRTDEREKGRHVQEQLKLFDALLDSRMKLQKALAASNALPISKTHQIAPAHTDTASLAWKLFHSLTDMRWKLAEADGLGSRKRSRRTADLDEAWDDIQGLHSLWQPWRDSTLDKWSSKVHIGAGANAQKKFKAINQSPSAQIQDTLMDMDRLVQRTQQSRYKLMNPAQEEVMQEPLELFDDTDFYQQQLRELVDQRMVDSKSDASAIRWAMSDSVKQKKKRQDMDTKASKGRKIRYNVHEKLENYMAPMEDSGWQQRQIDDLFGSLLGQKWHDDEETADLRQEELDADFRLFA